MTSKQWTLIALAVVLGGFSLYLNKDWFAGDNIQIHHRSRPARFGSFRRNRAATAAAVDPIFFAFDRKLKITSLKVIPVSEIETNKYPHPIWELVSDSNSVPIAEWSYGVPIRGMRPSVKGATPDPLEPGVKYRLDDPSRAPQSAGRFRAGARDAVSNDAGSQTQAARTFDFLKHTAHGNRPAHSNTAAHLKRRRWLFQ